MFGAEYVIQNDGSFVREFLTMVFKYEFINGVYIASVFGLTGKLLSTKECKNKREAILYLDNELFDVVELNSTPIHY